MKNVASNTTELIILYVYHSYTDRRLVDAQETQVDKDIFHRPHLLMDDFLLAFFNYFIYTVLFYYKLNLWYLTCV